MISMVRIDDRLIHGQVAVKWSKVLGIQRIIVVSDSIAKNEIQVSALKMAAPSGVKAVVLPVEKAVGILNDSRSSSMKILVLTNEPKIIAELLPLLSEKPTFLNLANYGRIGGTLSNKEKITQTVYLSPEDKKDIQEVFDMGYDYYYQPLPDDPKLSVREMLGGK